MRARHFIAALIVALALPTAPALSADFLAADLSTNVVKVASNFTGTEIILFGAFLQTKGRSFGAIGGSDVIVVVRGPPERITVRRKGRFGPIWMNMDSVTFAQAPSFYFVASTVPLAAITSTRFLDEQQIGLAHIALEPEKKLAPEKLQEFKTALIAQRAVFREPYLEHVPLYTEIVDQPDCRGTPRDGCFFRFSSNALFNAHLPIPATVPIGKLDISLYFVRNGRIVPNVEQSWILDVSRTGMEGWLYKHAVSNPILYGLGAILLAVTAGFGASLAVRK